MFFFAGDFFLVCFSCCKALFSYNRSFTGFCIVCRCFPVSRLPGVVFPVCWWGHCHSGLAGSWYAGRLAVSQSGRVVCWKSALRCRLNWLFPVAGLFILLSRVLGVWTGVYWGTAQSRPAESGGTDLFDNFSHTGLREFLRMPVISLINLIDLITGCSWRTDNGLARLFPATASVFFRPADGVDWTKSSEISTQKSVLRNQYSIVSGIQTSIPVVILRKMAFHWIQLNLIEFWKNDWLARGHRSEITRSD